jgi:hypothetical protein
MTSDKILYAYLMIKINFCRKLIRMNPNVMIPMKPIDKIFWCGYEKKWLLKDSYNNNLCLYSLVCMQTYRNECTFEYKNDIDRKNKIVSNLMNRYTNDIRSIVKKYTSVF